MYRRGSSMVTSLQTQAISAFKVGDLVSLNMKSALETYGTIKDVNKTINKVLVAWQGGMVKQHDPEEIQLNLVAIGNVKRRFGGQLSELDGEMKEKVANFDETKYTIRRAKLEDIQDEYGYTRRGASYFAKLKKAQPEEPPKEEPKEPPKEEKPDEGMSLDFGEGEDEAAPSPSPTPAGPAPEEGKPGEPPVAPKKKVVEEKTLREFENVEDDDVASELSGKLGVVYDKMESELDGKNIIIKDKKTDKSKEPVDIKIIVDPDNDGFKKDYKVLLTVSKKKKKEGEQEYLNSTKFALPLDMNLGQAADRIKTIIDKTLADF